MSMHCYDSPTPVARSQWLVSARPAATMSGMLAEDEGDATRVSPRTTLPFRAKPQFALAHTVAGSSGRRSVEGARGEHAPSQSTPSCPPIPAALHVQVPPRHAHPYSNRAVVAMQLAGVWAHAARFVERQLKQCPAHRLTDCGLRECRSGLAEKAFGFDPAAPIRHTHASDRVHRQGAGHAEDNVASVSVTGLGVPGQLAHS